jgi:hypothetical protein
MIFGHTSRVGANLGWQADKRTLLIANKEARVFTILRNILGNGGDEWPVPSSRGAHARIVDWDPQPLRPNRIEAAKVARTISQ